MAEPGTRSTRGNKPFPERGWSQGRGATAPFLLRHSGGARNKIYLGKQAVPRKGLCSLWIRAHTFLDIVNVEPVKQCIGWFCGVLPLTSADLMVK